MHKLTHTEVHKGTYNFLSHLHKTSHQKAVTWLYFPYHTQYTYSMSILDRHTLYIYIPYKRLCIVCVHKLIHGTKRNTQQRPRNIRRVFVFIAQGTGGLLVCKDTYHCARLKLWHLLKKWHFYRHRRASGPILGRKCQTPPAGVSWTCPR